MALKFILSICVLMHLIGHVASDQRIADEMIKQHGQVVQSAWYIGLHWAIFTLGLIGNIALIVIFSKKDLKLRFDSLIITLAVFDLVYMTTQLTISMIFYSNLNLELYSEKRILVILKKVAFSCSAFTAIAISLERYLLIRYNM